MIMERNWKIMKKKTLMLDLDQVITGGTWKEQIEEFLNERIVMEDVGYYLEDLLGNRKNEFYESLDEINMYKNAELKQNAYEVIQELNQQYELYIVSAYALEDIPNRTGEHLKNKYNFIHQKLPFLNQQQFIFINNKELCNFDIGIDDKINNLTNCKKKILYRAWHNKEIQDENIVIVENWLDIKKYLLESEE